MHNKWGEGNEVGAVYRLIESDLNRIGHSWMEGRLHKGDIVLCIKHTGDCFYDYCLLELYYNGIKAILPSRFGSYTFYGPPIWRPTEQEFNLLMAGQFLESGRCLNED